MTGSRCAQCPVIALLLCASAVFGVEPIRLGNGLTVLDVQLGPNAQAVTAGTVSYPHPRPRLAGFSPLVAITTSNKHSLKDIDYEHNLTTFYDCSVGAPSGGNCGALHAPADVNYVVGILDSGSVADLAAGSGATTLGLTGSYLTTNVVPIGGVGGEVDAIVTQPIGFYAQGLGAVGPSGTIDPFELVGHSNVSALAAPPIVCGGVELVSAFVGTPLIAFFNTVVRVDSPIAIVHDGRIFSGPEVRIQGQSSTLPEFDRAFAMEVGGIGAVTTASYFPVFDPEDLVTPSIPTLLSLSPLSIPTGGVFFANVQALMGEPGPTNFPTTMRLMVDTGAQTSIMSPAMAAELNLPIEPDFTVSACGVGGIIEGIPGYYIDYVKINAFGGALEFSRAPFVVLDLTSPEGGVLDGVLGMNFFWNRNVIFEPSLSFSSFFHVSDPLPFDYGDHDADYRVSLGDAAGFAICRSGPVPAPLTPDCESLDADGNVLLDLRDFARLQNCFSGDQPANPLCGQ